MEQEKNNITSIYAKKLKAGKRRTYFFDVRPTKGNDYYITITESIKNQNDQYDRHKIFLYKEDMLRFVQSLEETVQHIRTELLPDYDFENTYIPREHADNNTDAAADEDSWN